jgi:hypothetical protein
MIEASLEYRRFAERCRAETNNTDSVRQRMMLLEMALEWSRLAEQANRSQISSVKSKVHRGTSPYVH